MECSPSAQYIDCPKTAHVEIGLQVPDLSFQLPDIATLFLDILVLYVILNTSSIQNALMVQIVRIILNKDKTCCICFYHCDLGCIHKVVKKLVAMLGVIET